MPNVYFTENYSDLRNELIDKVLLIGTTIGLGVFIASLFPFSTSVINVDFFTDLVGIGILFATFLFRKRISLNFKVNITNTILLILLISDILENGINTPDFILLVLIPFFSILVYELKPTLLIFGFCSFIFLGLGHLYQLGYISSPDYDASTSSIFRWYETLLMISTVTFVITLFVNKYNKHLYNLIQSLEEQNKELVENQVIIKESLNEKSVLLQEIHHRVKNNLAVVSGLLSLQSYHINNNKLKLVLEENVNRIMSIAKVHEMLYESKNFNNISFDGYIKELSQMIISSMNQQEKSITFNTNITVDKLSINHGVPLGIIFNELITNSVKYGFVSMADNEIQIVVKQTGNTINVTYADNGVGIEDFEKATKKSLGFTLIQSLMQQIDATFSYETDNRFKLTFSFLMDSDEDNFVVA